GALRDGRDDAADRGFARKSGCVWRPEYASRRERISVGTYCRDDGPAVTRLECFSLRGLRNGRNDLGARDLERSPGELAGDRGPELSGEEGPHPSGDEWQSALAVAHQGQHEVGDPG